MNRTRVMILPGWGGSQDGHWQEWLAGEIAKKYGCVNFLEFSNIDAPNKELWLQELKDEIKLFNPTVIVCHSIANMLWFHLCAQESVALEKLFLVAPPSLKCDIKELSSFFPSPLPTALGAKECWLICSTNDPYATPEESSAMANKLNATLKVVDDGGHINRAGGFGEWPWIYSKIIEV